MSSMKDAKDVAAKPKEKKDFLYYMLLVQSLFILCNLKPEDEQNVKYIIMLMLILIAVLFCCCYFSSKFLPTLQMKNENFTMQAITKQECIWYCYTDSLGINHG